MAIIVNAGFIKVNSHILKRIEDNNKAAKRGVNYKRWDLCVAALYPIGICCVLYKWAILLSANKVQKFLPRFSY
jgi:hypothetical protein